MTAKPKRRQGRASTQPVKTEPTKYEPSERPQKCPTCSSPNNKLYKTRTDDETGVVYRYRLCGCKQHWVSRVRP